MVVGKAINKKSNFLTGVSFFLVHFFLVFGLLHSYSYDKPEIDLDYVNRVSGEGHWHRTLDLNRFDSVNYRRITLKGYIDNGRARKPHEVIRWFPGYPALAKALVYVTGWKVYAAFSFISFSLTLCFWLLLWQPHMVNVIGKKGLYAVSTLIVSWPGSFFWFTGMTEPVIGLIILSTIYLWFKEKENLMFLVLGYGTSVKQLFTPIALATLFLDFIWNKETLSKIIFKIVISLSGLLSFGIYCYMSFGDFFISVNSIVEMNAPNDVTLLNILNLKLYAQTVDTREGFVAVASLLYLFFEFIRICREHYGWKYLLVFWKKPKGEKEDFILWWFAFILTIFFVGGSADMGFGHFTSMMRYQVVNIPLFLLFGRSVRKVNVKQLVLLIFPVMLVSIYYLRHFIIKYWLGQWVS